ncbi:MAG: hypothetical protein PHH70_01915 [Candidatus Gracilibacteria bacterium]|nr:hypothetical protein [Candidatus Gracilibacteria bacterium]
MEEQGKYIGYFKYHGSLVADGVMDARKSAEALLGIDELMRFFLIKEEPILQQYELEIPIRIRKGSWEALIPETITGWVTVASIGTFLAAYSGSIAVKAGSDGLLETGPAKDIYKIAKGAIITVQWIIKIACHIGSMTKKQFSNAEFEKINGEDYIRIPNEKGEFLSVPKIYLDAFSKCPENILSKNAHIIEENREFIVGVFHENNSFEEISIKTNSRNIFYYENDNDILFPELLHGMYVELEGEVTRGNEKTNAIGFQYQDHILTCKPLNGSIAVYKNQIISQEDGHFFPPVKIRGVIDRTDKKGGFKEKRPMIIFSEILPIETDNRIMKLF